MPELPEVEVVRRSLNEFITGSKINKVSIFNKNLRYKISNKFKKSIQGQKIISIFRRGKFLLIQLENKNFILIHLGMTGKIFIKRKFDKTTVFTDYYFEKKIIKKHNHLGLKLSNSVDLIYNDIRKFGFIKFELKNNILNNQHIKLHFECTSHNKKDSKDLKPTLYKCLKCNLVYSEFINIEFSILNIFY